MLEPATATLEPPPAYALLSGLGMIAVGVAPVLIWQIRRRPAWRFAAIGAAAWVISVALKLAWAIMTNAAVLSWLQHALGKAAGVPVGCLYIGLLTGVFECGFTWIVMRRPTLRRADGKDIIAFGIAFGAIEAIILGAISMTGVMAALLFWSQLPPEAQQPLSRMSDVTLLAMPVFERAYTLAAHVLSCVLIAWAVQRGRPLWFWMSFIFKSLLDALAVWGVAQFGATSSTAGLVQLETLLFVYTAVWIAAVVMLNRRTPRAAQA